MKIRQKVGWLVSILTLCGLPAYANNPPQPDGILSIFLIFPAVILGARLAGAAPIQKSRWKRIVTGILLAFCAFVTAGGTAVAFIPLVLILAYGIARGGQIIRLGQRPQTAFPRRGGHGIQGLRGRRLFRCPGLLPQFGRV